MFTDLTTSQALFLGIVIGFLYMVAKDVLIAIAKDDLREGVGIFFYVVASLGVLFVVGPIFSH